MCLLMTGTPLVVFSFFIGASWKFYSGLRNIWARFHKCFDKKQLENPMSMILVWMTADWGMFSIKVNHYVRDREAASFIFHYFSYVSILLMFCYIWYGFDKVENCSRHSFWPRNLVLKTSDGEAEQINHHLRVHHAHNIAQQNKPYRHTE